MKTERGGRMTPTLASVLRRDAAVRRDWKRLGFRTENILGELAEQIVAQGLRITLEGNSHADFDARDKAGRRYQIKSRRGNGTRPPQLGEFKHLDEKRFDLLVVVLFNTDNSIRQAATIPHAVVLDQAKYKPSRKRWRLHAKPSLFTARGVVDITARLNRLLEAR